MGCICSVPLTAVPADYLGAVGAWQAKRVEGSFEKVAYLRIGRDGGVSPVSVPTAPCGPLRAEDSFAIP
jgi:hypothetical protein